MQKIDPTHIKFTFQFNGKLTLCVVIVLSIMLKLGFWQLDRESEKLTILKTRQERLLADPVVIESLNKEDELNFQQVSLQGRYINDKSILIDNQIVDGKFGYEVITAFEASSMVVMVSRGWVQGSLDRNKLPDITSVVGSVKLKAEVYVPMGKPFTLGGDPEVGKWPQRVLTINLLGLEENFTKPLFPFVVRLGERNPGVYFRHWKSINISPEKHRGYALQWFSMSFALCLLYFTASTNIVSILRSK